MNNGFSEIKVLLTNHRNKINKIIDTYRKNEEHPKQILKDAAFLSFHQQNLINAQADVKVLREETSDKINFELDYIQSHLMRWVNAPLDSKQFDMIRSLHSSNLRFSREEIESLSVAANGNYWASRYLSDMAQKSGIKGYGFKYNLEAYTKCLKEIKNECEIFIKGYCGERPVKEILPDENRPSDHIIFAASSCVPFSNRSAILIGALLFDKDGVPMVHTSLTRDDLTAVSALYEGYATPEQLSLRTAEIVHNHPELKDTIRMTPYCQYLPSEDNKNEEAKY